MMHSPENTTPDHKKRPLAAAVGVFSFRLPRFAKADHCAKWLRLPCCLYSRRDMPRSQAEAADTKTAGHPARALCS